MPSRRRDHILDHQRVDVDKAELEEVERKDADLLIFQTIGRDLAALPEEQKAIDRVPVLDDVESLVDLATQLL